MSGGRLDIVDSVLTTDVVGTTLLLTGWKRAPNPTDSQLQFCSDQVVSDDPKVQRA